VHDASESHVVHQTVPASRYIALFNVVTAKFDEVVPRLDLGIVQHFRCFENRAGGNARLLQLNHQFVFVALTGEYADLLIELIVVILSRFGK
jgi:hypothetical protein